MRLIGRFTTVLLIVFTLVVGATAAAIIVTQTAWFRDRLRGYVVRQANQYLNGQVSIERLGGNLFFGVEMENITVSMDGAPVVAVKDLGLDYSVFQLIARGLFVDGIRLNQPVLYLQREGDTWSISRLIKKQAQEADRRGPLSPMAIGQIVITDGTVVIDQPAGIPGVEVPKRVEHLDAKLAFKYEPVHYSIDIAHVSFRGSSPEIGLNELSGAVAVKDDDFFVDKLAIRTEESSLSIDGAVQNYLTRPVFNLRISSDKVSLPEIAKIVPAAAGIHLQPAFELAVAGPTDRLGVEMNVRSPAGELAGRLHADVAGESKSVVGDVSVRHLNLAPILDAAAQESDITASAKIDVHGASLSDVKSLRGTLHLDAPRVVAAGYTAEQITADARLEGRRIAIDGRAAAYGATATATGKVTLAEGKEPIGYDLTGQTRHVDLRAMPRKLNAPLATTDVNADYHVTGAAAAGARTNADLKFLDSTVAGAKIVAGSLASISVDGKDVAYHADMTIADIDLKKIGEQFNVQALATERYRSSINGHVVANGTGIRPEDMKVTASGTMTDSSLLSGKIPSLTFDGSVARNTAHLKANGEAVGFDPGALSGRPSMTGAVGGMLDVDATVQHVSTGVTLEMVDATARITLQPSTVAGGRIPKLAIDGSLVENTVHVKMNGEAVGFDPGALSGKPAIQGEVGGLLDIDATLRNISSGVTPETVDGTAQISLHPSTVGGLAISSAKLDADYRDSTGVIRSFDVKGRDLNVNATGTLALNDTGRSDLKVHADTPSLEEIGKLFDKPLMGIANVDATVTGNKRELQATGDLTAGALAYDTTLALTMSTKYTVTVPELTPEQANVTADTTATFVTIAGQEINELHAKTDYKNQKVTFDATAKQPQRSMGASGSLVLHPDHQEVHLQQLGLEAQNVKWDLAPGTQPAIQYGNDAVSVEHLELVSADQKIAADGTFGRPGDSLKVSLVNVELAGIDTLMLRPPQFTGRLNGTTTVSGERETPNVKADFQIDQGAFRQFHYDMFSGSADYSGTGVDVDMKLQQNPTTWLTAKGYLPMALLKGSAVAGHHRTVPGEDRIDLHIDSTPIDLGLVQGFTTALTNVTGTLQAKIDVAGSAGDPHPTGAITVQNAAFTVDSTGVKYTDLDGEIDLQPERVHIAEIKVLDNQKKPLTLTGDLAVHELSVGGVNLALKASDFKVIDNKMGNVRINTDIRIAGDLGQPRIEGDLGISTGVVNLDPIIAAAGESAYATKQTEYLTKPDNKEQVEAPKPSIYEALQMDVRVTVPNDLVVKGQNLQPSGTLVGLGSVNVTLGGDLYASKVPYDQLRLTGTVNTVRGTYDFQGRRFEILRDGTIRFDGLDELDPTLDVTTQRVIQAVTANVAVRGTLTNPEIVLSSTPPLEEADILALIVFNQPVNQLGEGQQISVAQRAQALATGAAASELAQSIAKVLNLDTFEISTAPDSGAAAQFTIGQQLGQNVYVKLEQGVGDQSQTNFVLEYELAKWLRLRTNVLQGSSTQQQLFQRMQGSGADLLFLFSR